MVMGSMIAPTTPSTMSSSGPSPERLTIMLPIQPATRPTTSQAIMPIANSSR